MELSYCKAERFELTESNLEYVGCCGDGVCENRQRFNFDANRHRDTKAAPCVRLGGDDLQRSARLQGIPLSMPHFCWPSEPSEMSRFDPVVDLKTLENKHRSFPVTTSHQTKQEIYCVVPLDFWV
jgi:hypothetical protein